MTDKELLDYMETQEGAAIISDDFGHWAVTGAGFQNVPQKTPADIQTTHIIEKKQWKKSIRAAIRAHMKG